MNCWKFTQLLCALGNLQQMLFVETLSILFSSCINKKKWRLWSRCWVQKWWLLYSSFPFHLKQLSAASKSESTFLISLKFVISSKFLQLDNRLVLENLFLISYTWMHTLYKNWYVFYTLLPKNKISIYFAFFFFVTGNELIVVARQTSFWWPKVLERRIRIWRLQWDCWLIDVLVE